MIIQIADDNLTSNAGALIAVVMCGLLGLVASIALAEMLGAPSHFILPVLPVFVLSVVAMIGWSARTSDRARFFCSSHGLPPVAGALASLAAWFAMVPFLPFTGALYSSGFDGLAYVLGPVAGLLISGVLIAPYLAEAKPETIAQFIGQRAGPVAEALVALVVLCVCFVVFAAALQSAANFGSAAFQVPFNICLGVAVAAAVIAALPGGSNGANWTGMAYALVFLLSLIIVGAAVAYQNTGLPSAQVSAGIALRNISDLEFSMIDKGVASATSLKLHSKPSGNRDLFLLVSLTLALVASVVPMLLQTSMAQQSLGRARRSSSWLIAFAVYVALSAVAWSAFTKHAVYQFIDRQTEIEALPEWFEPLLATDAVRIYGASLHLLNRVVPAVADGAKTPAAVAEAFSGIPQDSKAWAALKEPVKAELIKTAEAMSTSTELPSNFGWLALREQVLPVAAKAAGNTNGTLTLQSLQIDPEKLVAALPSITGLPGSLLSMALAAFLCIPLAVASAALAVAASALNHDLLESLLGQERVEAIEPLGTRMCVALLAATGFWIAGLGLNLSGLTVCLLSVAAAALFPALVMGIWVRRAGGMSIVIGMATAIAIAAYLAWPVVNSADGIIAAWAAIAKQGAVILAIAAGLLMSVLSSFVLPKSSPEQDGVVLAARGRLAETGQPWV